jgi:hypothetical protein
MTAVRGAAFAWAVLLTLSIVLPQLSKAFDVDDTIFLLQAEHLLGDPLGPYSFALNWSSASKPALFNNFNPPLLGYYLAAAGRWLGFREAPLHLAAGLFVLLFGWWTYRWAGACGVRPGLAMILALGAPPLAASVDCMPDIPHVALGIGGLYHLHYALSQPAPPGGRLMAAGLLLALAVLMKYPALLFVVLAAALVWRQPRTWWVLAIPVAALALLVGWQLAIHGQTHFFQSQRIKLFGFWEMLVLNVLLLGGLAPGACVLALVGGGWRRAAAAVAAGVIALAAWFWAGTTTRPELRLIHNDHPGELLTFVALGAAGVAVAAVAIVVARRLERFLGIWIVVGLVFAAWYPEFPAPRRLFAVLPPMVILVLLRSSRPPNAMSSHNVHAAASSGVDEARFRHSWGAWLAAGLQAALAALIAAADFERASTYRAFVAQHAPEWSGRTVWTLGHDGWQWYTLRAGWNPFEAGRSVPRTGDLFVDPRLLVKQIVYLQPAGVGRFEVVGVPEGTIEPRRYGSVRLLDLEVVQATGMAPVRTGYLPSGINIHGYLLPYVFFADYPLAEFAVYEFE